MSIEVARDYRRRGKYALGLATAESLGGGPDALAEQARALVRLGRATEAVERTGRAIALPDAVDICEVWLARAEALLAAGRWAEAREAVEHAAVHQPPGLHRTSALVWDARAAAVQAVGDPEAALGHATRATAMLDQIQADPADRAQALHTLAEAQHRCGRYRAADATWDQVLELRQAHLGADHPELVGAWVGQGLSRSRAGQPAQALPCFQAALALAEAVFSPWHPARAAVHHGLAQALHRLGDFEGAREHFGAAVPISERSQGKDHVDTWVSRFELGRAELDCGQVEEGLARMSAAREAVAARLGSTHPLVVSMDRWL